MDLRAETIIEDAQFKNADYSHTDFRFKELRNCLFTKCNFAEAQFHECRFNDCEFVNCDLSLIGVPQCSFVKVRFKGCKVIGVQWHQAAWPKAAHFPALAFDDCAVNYSSFFGLTLSKFTLTESIAREVDFREAVLESASFRSTDLSGSLFLHTNLTKADFTRATNYTISPALNTLKKAKFSLPEAMALLRSLDIVLDGDT